MKKMMIGTALMLAFAVTPAHAVEEHHADKSGDTAKPPAQAQATVDDKAAQDQAAATDKQMQEMDARMQRMQEMRKKTVGVALAEDIAPKAVAHGKTPPAGRAQAALPAGKGACPVLPGG